MSNLSKYHLFVERLGLRTPIIQAPMANVSTPQLAGEVHKAGGLGSLPLSPVNLTKDVNPVFDLILRFRESAGAKAIVNCNFFCFDPKEQHKPSDAEKENWRKLYASISESSVSEIQEKVPEIDARAVVSFAEFEQTQPEECAQFVKRLIEAGVGVVLFHFGIPTKQTIATLQKGKIMVLGTATSVAEARHLIDNGVDGIVLQGYGAGGHRGNYLESQTLDENLSTFALFSLVKRVTQSLSQAPFLIVAGGIVDGEAAANYLQDGAAAVQLGTVFITASESAAPPYISDCVADGREIPTLVTLLITGRPARLLATPFVRAIMSEQKVQNYELPTFGYATAAYRSFASGKPEYGFYLAGENYHLVLTGANTSDIIARIGSEIDAALEK